MSDELVEGRSLRQRPPEEKPELKHKGSRATSKDSGPKKPAPEDPPSGPYVVLEPPTEGRLAAIRVDEDVVPQGLSKKAEDEDSGRAPDLPWSIFDSQTNLPIIPDDELPAADADSLMKLPRIEDDPAPPPKAPVNTDPAEFVPQLHTPTGEMRPIKDDEPDPRKAKRAEPPPTPEGSHTPGIMPKLHIDDDDDDDDLDDDDDSDIKANLSRFRPHDEPSGEVVDADWVRDVDAEDEHTMQPISRRPVESFEERLARRRELKQEKVEKVRSRPSLNIPRPVVIGVVVVIVVAVATYFLNASGILSQITFPFPSPTPGQGISGIPTIAATLGTQSPAETETPTPTESGVVAATQGRIAFVSTRDGNFEIYVLDVAANRVTRLTNDPASDRNPAWSPDGEQIIFVSDRSGTDNLYMVSASGGTAVRLTVGPASDRNPAWSPNRDQIVFSRETIDGSRLVTMPASCVSSPETCESATRLLTPGGYDRFPAFAPDGSMLAFAASEFPGGSSVIAMLNPDGSGYSSVRGTGSSDFGPSWGPDSSRLAFVSYADGDYDIWVMAADGSSLMQITNVDSADVSPSWSPDGGTLVYASDRGGDGSFDLYLVPSTCLTATGGCDTSPVRLTEAAGDDLDPAWYPE